jgi:arabinose-5-phosphate isomerase
MSAQDDQKQQFVKVAENVLQEEARILSALSGAVSDAIADAAIIMGRKDTRIIVTGVGKSGHVARKLAATLSSIGKPAYFVHATEASHGDMGMFGESDAVLALSNSGETPELSDVLHYCNTNSLQLIAVTSGADSTLGRIANVAIVYPQVEEVCIIGRAPTTSTVVMMAIGDAITVCLSHILKTTDDMFGRFHPGGSLGARLKTVTDVMHSGDQLPVVSAETSMHEAMITMSQSGLGITCVKDVEARISGIITDGDLRRAGPDVWGKVAGDVANYSPYVVASDMYLTEALDLMNRNKVTSLVVGDAGGEISGILHIHDCLRAAK